MFREKVGEELDFQEDYLFWRLADFLITNQDYRLVQMARNDQELWLENVSNKQAQLIRIVRRNLDWSNWLQRDIEIISSVGERFRKRYLRGELHLINIYVTPYPPVDDYQFLIDKPYLNQESNKTVITTTLLESNQLSNSLKGLSDCLGYQIPIALEKEYDEQDISSLKQIAISHSANKLKKEKAIFENGKPFFTYILLVIQIAVLLVMELNGGSTNSSTLIKFGAKFNPLIIEGQWWRFLTPIFIHIGFLHLIMNSIALYYIGPLVERIYGNFRFILIYLFAGFTGVLASFAFSANLSAGASGAIFGCFGALLYFGLIYPKLFFRTMGMNILVVIGLNLAFGFSVQGIDNAGHIGGLIGGFLASGILYFPKGKKPLLQTAFLVISSAAVFGFLQLGYGDSTKAVDTHSSFVLAQTYVENGDYDQAYTVLKDVQDNGEKSAELLFLLSYVEIKKGMENEAKDHLLEVIKIDSSFHEAYYNLALVCINEQQLEKAKEYAQKALKLKPEKTEYKDLVKKINAYLAQSSGVGESL